MSINKKEILDKIFGLNGYINIKLFDDKVDDLVKYLKCFNESYKCPNYINIIYSVQMLENINKWHTSDEEKFNFLLYFIWKFYKLRFQEPIDLGNGQILSYNIHNDLFTKSYNTRFIYNALKALTFHFQYYINKEIEKLPSITTLLDNVKTTFEELPFYISIHIAKNIVNEYVNKLIYMDYKTRENYYETLHDLFNKYHIDDLDEDIELFNINNIKYDIEYYFPVLNIPIAKDIFDKYFIDKIKLNIIWGNDFKSEHFMFSISDILKIYCLDLERKMKVKKISEMTYHNFTEDEYYKYKNVFIDCANKALRHFRNYNLRLNRL